MSGYNHYTTQHFDQVDTQYPNDWYSQNDFFTQHDKAVTKTLKDIVKQIEGEPYHDLSLMEETRFPQRHGEPYINISDDDWTDFIMGYNKYSDYNEILPKQEKTYSFSANTEHRSLRHLPIDIWEHTGKLDERQYNVHTSRRLPVLLGGGAPRDDHLHPSFHKRRKIDIALYPQIESMTYDHLHTDNETQRWLLKAAKEHNINQRTNYSSRFSID